MANVVYLVAFLASVSDFRCCVRIICQSDYSISHLLKIERIIVHRILYYQFIKVDDIIQNLPCIDRITAAFFLERFWFKVISIFTLQAYLIPTKLQVM